MRLVELAFGERNAVEKAFLESLGKKNPVDDVSPVCKAEYQSVAAQLPRLTFGYTALDANSMNLRYTIETTPAVGVYTDTVTATLNY